MGASVTMNFEQARYNMVEQQIRPWEVLDPAVLDLLFAVRREQFVSGPNAALAFADMEIPIGHGEAMMQPKVEARILQELGVREGETAYEVGTGSGYLTALLARRAKHVTTAEIHEDLLAAAAERLDRIAVKNVTLVTGDSARSPLGEAGYDVIVLTGSTPELPPAFLERLNPGGRLFAVIGDAPVMKATVFTRRDGGIARVEVFETLLKPLLNAQAPARFRF
jgi:protein-L-isoaspartate(D-aspartate) O-methyltransferase